MKNCKEFFLDKDDLTINEIYLIAHDAERLFTVSIAENSLKKMEQSREFILKKSKENKPIYGINTGFGALANKQIAQKDLNQLQINLVRGHCTGVGQPFDCATTRAIMLIRANCLVSGHSGINPKIVRLLLDFINFNINPIVPSKGSVGASGDLAPLSHIALALIGEGEVIFDGKKVMSDIALKKIHRDPAKLGPKDGLALINGTAVMAALGALALHEADILAKLADISCCMTLEGLRGTSNAYYPGVSKLKPHPGQLECNNNLNILLGESEIFNSHSNCNKVQDPYSLRCVPQVHGACRQTILHARQVIQTEINSVTDNPLIFVEENKIISGGNFHGEAIALAMDYMSMGMAEFCSICERRIEKMMNPHFSDLPHFLVKDSGINSGLMIAHVTVAALASENKYLAHPASIDSIPTSTDKEDHVSMGVTAGRKLQEILNNLKTCLSVELLCSTQAFEFLRPLKSSPPLEAVYQIIRDEVPPITVDRPFYKDIEKIIEIINSQKIVTKVESIIGKLF